MNRQNVLRLSMVALAAFCIGADSDSGIVKLRPAPHKPGDIVSDQDWSILPRSDLYEVGASKIDWSSIRDLPNSGYRKLTEAEAKAYTGEYYQCPSGKTPFLLPAVYCKDAPGKFRAEQRGRSISIVFGATFRSHGLARTEYERTAVVANLDFTPAQTYFEDSTAE